MDQVTKLVALLKEKVPEGKILAPETVVNVIKKKIDPSVIHNIGGEASLLARVKLLLAPPAPAPAPKKRAASSSSDSDSDDDDDSDDDSSSNDEDEEDYDSDDDEDDEEDDEEVFDDDSTTDDEDEDNNAKPGDRRQRESDKEGADKPENTASAGNGTDNQVDEMLLFLKKCGLSAAVSRKRNTDEAAQDYINNVLKVAFASKSLDMQDLSKNAVSRYKMRAELEALQKEGADLSLNKEQRRGKPIFDANGKVIGITGGQMIKDAGTVSASLMDDE